MLLKREDYPRMDTLRLNTRIFFLGFHQACFNPGILLIGLLEMQTKLAIYAIRAFMPVLMLSNGASLIEAGLFLSIQETSNALVRPFSVRMVNKLGFLLSISCGLILLALGLLIIASFGLHFTIWTACILTGCGQAIFTPSAEGMTALYAPKTQLGITFGIVGSLRNLGKILGPILAGLLLSLIHI